MCRLVVSLSVHYEVALLTVDRQQRLERSSFSLALVLTSAPLHRAGHLTNDATKRASALRVPSGARVTRENVSANRRFFDRLLDRALSRVSDRFASHDRQRRRRVASNDATTKAAGKESGTNEP